MKGAGFFSLFYFKSVKNLHSLFYCLQTWMCCLSSQVQACFILLLHFYLKYRLSDCSYVVLFWYFYILLFLYFYTVLFLYRTSLIFPADIACWMYVTLSEWLALHSVIVNICQSGILTVLFGCYMAGATWNCFLLAREKLSAYQSETALPKTKQ